MHSILSEVLEFVPYLLQAIIYGVAFRYTRIGGHPPSQTYLASSVLHLTLALRPLI